MSTTRCSEISDTGCSEISEVGESSGWVEAKTECPHLRLLHSSVHQLPKFDSLCQGCGDTQENWACLSCLNVFCGRYINAHMLAHNGKTNHPIAISYRDLSVWCFSCNSYLDARVIKELQPAFEVLHLMKFGEAPPIPVVELETKTD